LFNDVQNGLFSELKTKRPIDSYRRRLQKSYVDKLSSMINSNVGGGVFTISLGNLSALSSVDISKTDIPSIARAQLGVLKNEMNTAITSTTDKMSKIHLLDLRQRIKDALDPRK